MMIFFYLWGQLHFPLSVPFLQNAPHHYLIPIESSSSVVSARMMSPPQKDFSSFR